MPATQHDAWLWVAGGARDAVFDSTLTVLRQLDGLAAVAHEVGGRIYQHTSDLTGFVDGTENPPMIEALDVAAVPDGREQARASCSSSSAATSPASPR
jgi:putative iron-dependent peroxidase